MKKAKARRNPPNRWAPALIGSVLLAACSTASPPVGAGGGSGGCVETELCQRTAHWDTSACACVPNLAEGGAAGEGGGAGTGGGAGKGGAPCVDNVLCVKGSHWDASACKCVPTAPGCSGDSDCHGPLPQLCQVCSNGSTGCAHHECIAGKCAIVTCSAALAP